MKYRQSAIDSGVPYIDVPSRIYHIPRVSHPLTSSPARYARSGADPSFLTQSIMATATSRVTVIACVPYTQSQHILVSASSDGRYLKFVHTRTQEVQSNTNTSSPESMTKIAKFFSVLRGAFRIQTRSNQMVKAASHRWINSKK